MKVAVVGVNSFLGQAIVQQELSVGSNVVGIYHQHKNFLTNEISYQDIETFLTSKENYDVVYVVSAYIPIQDVNHNLLYQVNVALLEKILHLHSKSKIVLASSVSVYEGNNDDVLTENSYTSPQSAYAISKLWAEKLVVKSVNYAIVRISSMYGVGMKLNTFLPKIILSGLQQNRIILLGEGNRLQNYVSVKEVALTMFLASRRTENAIYLATSEKGYSNFAVAKMIQKINPQIDIEFNGYDNSKSYLYDDQLTRIMLNKTKSNLLEDEILELYEWIKKS